MKIIRTLKYSGLLALVLAGAVGCAAAPTETATEQVGADQTAAAKKAIADARVAVEAAEAAGAAWRDSAKLLGDAEAALKAGDTGTAIQLANQARRQAENALAQKESEAARLGVADDGADNYTVRRGDNLWNISARQDIYGNPYQWPLIYKANRDKIRDADMIYPEQVFSIERNVGAAEADAAVRHARTRGAWSLGTAESSDRAYLAR